MKHAALAFLLSAGILAACGRVERKVRIAVLADLTGPREVYGEGIRRATALALEERHSALLSTGWNAELQAFDTNVSPPELETTVRGIAADPEIVCTILHADSDGNLSAAQIFHSAGVADILPVETAPLPAAAVERETIFLSPDDRSHGESDAEGALSRTALRILLTTDSDPHALSIGAGFHDRAQAGGSIVYDFRILTAQDLSDWTSSYKSIRPDLVYFSGPSELARSILARMESTGVQGTLFFAQDRPEDPLPADFASDSVTLMFSPATADSTGAAGAPAPMEDYRSVYGADPPATAALGYDATAFCLSPLLEKNARDLSPRAVRSWVLDRLRSGAVFQGVTGSYDFSGERRCRISTYLRSPTPGSGWKLVPAPEPVPRATADCRGETF